MMPWYWYGYPVAPLEKVFFDIMKQQYQCRELLSDPI